MLVPCFLCQYDIYLLAYCLIGKISNLLACKSQSLNLSLKKVAFNINQNMLCYEVEPKCVNYTFQNSQIFASVVFFSRPSRSLEQYIIS